MTPKPILLALSLSIILTSPFFTGCGGGGNSGGTGGGGGGGGTGGNSNPVPGLTSVTPNQVGAGSPGITINLTGSSFIAGSAAEWNGKAATTTYVSATALTAYLPPEAFASAGTVTITVVNPAPGGGTSGGATFTVGPSLLNTATVSAIANDIVWDPVNKLIYLSLLGSTATNGTSIQTLDPSSGTLGNPIPVGSVPDKLAISANSTYLYVGLDSGYSDGAIPVQGTFVQPLTLPGFVKGNVFSLGFDPKGIDGNYFAMQIAPAPNSETTLAVIRGSLIADPQEEGGIVIYDKGNPRLNWLCGDAQIPIDGSQQNDGCIGANPGHGPNGFEWDSMDWSPDASEIFAADGASTAANFYIVPVNSDGFGSPAVYQSKYVSGIQPPRLYFSIHYDATTGYLFEDNGLVLNPATGSVAANLGNAGNVIPDGQLGAVFLLWWNTKSGGYELDSFDLHTLTLIASQLLPSIIGTPVKMIRWGADGLAIQTLGADYETATPSGAIYILEGPFIGNPKSAGG